MPRHPSGKKTKVEMAKEGEFIKFLVQWLGAITI
jgi:hypothetical protein